MGTSTTDDNELVERLQVCSEEGSKQQINADGHSSIMASK